MSQEDGPAEGIHAIAAESARKSGSKPRSRNAARHETNVKLRRQYISTLSRIGSTDSGIEKSRLKDELSAIGGEFVTANGGLVGNMARTFNPHDMGRAEDYKAYALQGLWEAFTKWDPERGVAFSTFSRPFMSGRMQRAVRKWEHSHLTQQEWADRARAIQARTSLSESLGREPTSQEIAEKTGYAEDSVERMFNNPVSSLEDRYAMPEDRDGRMGDELLPDIADLVAEGTDIEVLLAELDGIELMAAIFSNESISVAPRKLAHVAQSTGVGRNQLGAAHISGTAKMTRSILRGQYGKDPSSEAIAEAMGIPSRSFAVEKALRKSTEPSELRKASARGRKLLHAAGAAGAPAARMHAIELQLKAVESRMFDMLAEVVSEVANTYEQADGSSWLPAAPELIADLAWKALSDHSLTGTTGTRSLLTKAVREGLPSDMRRKPEDSDPEDTISVDGEWIKRRIIR